MPQLQRKIDHSQKDEAKTAVERIYGNLCQNGALPQQNFPKPDLFKD
jgi:hypothetical protein